MRRYHNTGTAAPAGIVVAVIAIAAILLVVTVGPVLYLKAVDRPIPVEVKFEPRPPTPAEANPPRFTRLTWLLLDRELNLQDGRLGGNMDEIMGAYAESMRHRKAGTYSPRMTQEEFEKGRYGFPMRYVVRSPIRK